MSTLCKFSDIMLDISSFFIGHIEKKSGAKWCPFGNSSTRGAELRTIKQLPKGSYFGSLFFSVHVSLRQTEEGMCMKNRNLKKFWSDWPLTTSSGLCLPALRIFRYSFFQLPCNGCALLWLTVNDHEHFMKIYSSQGSSWGRSSESEIQI